MLETQTYGTPTEKPSLLVVHGLFGAGRNWRSIAKRLASDRLVITVDMRNHGDSFWDEKNSYFDMANDLAKVIETVEGPVEYLGHSMGGKAGMVLALQYPDLIKRMIIVDIAPVAYSHSQVSYIDAMMSLEITNITRRTQADVALAEQIPENSVRAFLLQSLILNETGNRWKLNLESLKSNMDAIVGFPDVQGRYDGECLFIRGALSDYVLPGHQSKIGALFPNAKITSVEEAGHWVHAENFRGFIAKVERFLAQN